MRPGRTVERGNAAVLLLLVVVIVVSMFAATLMQSSTTAAITEQNRYAAERARQNAKSALVDADPWMEGELAPAIEAILTQASDARVPFGGAHLLTLEFPEYSKRFTMAGAGATAEDYVDVTATVSVAGPPIQRTVAGVTASSAPVRIDEYRFNVRTVAEGHSSGDAVARYEHTSLLIVAIEIGPGA